MAKHYMNPAYGAHVAGADGGADGDEARGSGGHAHPPHIHIHPHHDESGKHTGTTVHIMHHDGRHEKHDHSPGDAEGIASHIHEHYAGGGSEGQSMDGSHATERVEDVG